MQKTKKILSALLALVMVIGIMPAAAFASPCELEEHTHGEGCYTLTCELSEHSHTACDLSCDKEAHTHCYDDKCEIEAHKHTACDLSCDKEAHAHCYTFTCEKAEHKHNDDCVDEEVVYVAQIGTTQYETLQAAADVGGSIKLLADVTESVVVAKDATIDLNGFDVISTGDAFEITAGTLTVNGEGVVAGGSTGVGSWTAIWANGGKAILNGGTYAVGGDSSTADVTHQNDVIYTKNGGSVVINGGYFENDGTVWTLNENDANRGTIVVKGGTFENWNPANNVSEGPATNFVADGYVSTKNGDNYVVSVKVETEPDAPEVPEVPEEPVTPDIDPDARCGKYEHQHNACDLSCKLYAHTHCHGDTCEIEEHKHTACDLSCDKEEHIHCYPATETPDEPEIPEEPELPEEPVIPELPKPEEVEGYELNCDKGAHKHTACDLSCPYDEHTHCFSDTCEIEEHKHIACDLSCDKVEHVHCYDLIKEDEPEDDETIVITNVDVTVVAPKVGDKAVYDMELVLTPDFEVPAEDMYVEWYKNTTDDIEDENWEPLAEDDVFEAGYYYAFLMEVIIQEGADFDKDCVLTFNGGEFVYSFASPETEDTYATVGGIYVFDKLTENETPDTPVDPEDPDVPGDEPETDVVVDNVSFTIPAPEVGKELPIAFSISSTEPAFDTVNLKLLWMVDGVPVPEGHKVEEGVTYSLTVYAPLKDGFVPAKEIRATLNGEPALVWAYKDDSTGVLGIAMNVDFPTLNTHVHKLTKVEAKKETCTEKGNSEYYTCECGKWFKDEKAETEIIDKTSVEIKAAGHKAATEWSRDAKSHWHKCTVCKEPADTKVAHDFDKDTGKICQTCKYDVDNPKTGSEAHITVMAVVMTMSVVVMAGVAAYFVWDKKRKH